MRKIKVGVLGATGVVGQNIVNMLADHPWFELTEVAASEKSSGKDYEDVMESRWSLSSEMPERARNLKVKDCKIGLDCDIVLSALDSSVAYQIEIDFAKAGYAVSSNAKSHRMEEDVPLIIPEINAGHLSLIEKQKKARKWKGFIITDPNCSTIGLCMALKPLQDSFGVEKVIVTTMQALSGAGYPGVPSLDIVDNVIPYIRDEEEKIETEPKKIFGKINSGAIKNANIEISASCNRVPVRHGHMECVSVKLGKSADAEKIASAMNNFDPLKDLKLPSGRGRPLMVTAKNDRPQPRLDAFLGSGMTTIVGRIRKCNILDYKFVLLSNNIIRGAAGAALLNAELLKAKGYLELR